VYSYEPDGYALKYSRGKGDGGIKVYSLRPFYIPYLISLRNTTNQSGNSCCSLSSNKVNWPKEARVMTQKTFSFVKKLLMLLSGTFSLTLVFFLELSA